ncbi:MAG: hypothetical protein Q7S32_00140 [bacterium]|nr:hypothetical protein [bacterium]
MVRKSSWRSLKILITLLIAIRLLFFLFTFSLARSFPVPGMAVELSSGPAIDYINEIKLKGGVTGNIRLFVMPKRFPNRAFIASGWLDNFIVTSEEELAWPTEPLRGILAHEIGHLALSHISFWMILVDDMTFNILQLRFQAEADAWAVRVVGRGALEACLKRIETEKNLAIRLRDLDAFLSRMYRRQAY